MVSKKSRTYPAVARPRRLQTYLTEQEGGRLDAFAASMGVTASLAARELILRGLDQEKEKDGAHEHVDSRV